MDIIAGTPEKPRTVHTRNVPSSTYTHVYNDKNIIQQRQNRPKLKLADFHVLRTLGTGSFGRVHLVQSRVNARYYAIKVLKKSEVVRLKQGKEGEKGGGMVWVWMWIIIFPFPYSGTFKQ